MENYSTIYKILTQDEFKQFKKEQIFKGTLLDLKDGYIHMSKNIEQVNRVKNKYYKDSQVILLHINANMIPNLVYEKISNGDTYPHLYEELLFDYIVFYELI